MSLRFIYGRAGSGKSYHCLNEIKSKINNKTENPLVLIVPEQFSLQAERNLAKVMETGGIIETEVLSFRRMAYRVFNEVGGITSPRINSAGKCIIIHKILDNTKKQFEIFSKSAGQKGFVNTICDIIAEFKRYNVTPDVLENICKTVDNLLLEKKLQELAIIYREYENAIENKYKDADDDLTLLYNMLDCTNMFDGAEIWIDEFSGFTSQEYKVIGKLMQKAYQVNICLCTDYLMDELTSKQYIDVFSPIKIVYSKLAKMALDNNITMEPPVFLDSLDNKVCRFKNSPELQHLERYYFAFPYKKYKDGKDKSKRLKDGNVSIFTATNIYTEIENAARHIIALCRDRGLRYKDITVVCGNLDVYEKFISVIFSQYGIPFFIDKKRDIIKHPLIQLILSVFEIFVYDWSYEAVFRYLKTGLTNILREDIDIIENYVLACGIRGKKWTRDKAWDYIPDMIWKEEEKQKYAELLNKINDIRNKIIAPLLKFHKAAVGRKTTLEIAEALFQVLCDIDVPNSIEVYIEKFKSNGNLALAAEYGQVWNITMEAINQVVELMGDEKPGIKKFKDILEICFSEYRIGLIPPALDQVLVGSVERSKIHDVKALYILGVNDGVFPVPSEGEGILSDSDRMTLRALGVELASDTRTKAFESQYITYSTLTTAENFLRLSVPISDHEGKTLRPSIVVTRLRKIFPDISEESNITTALRGTNSELELISQKAPTFNELLTVMRKAHEGGVVNPIWKDVHNWFLSQDDWKSKCETINSALNYTNMVNKITKYRADSLYGDPIYSSVSRLEKYASCPFSYYIEYGLKVRERKVFNLAPPDIGTFLHRVIEEFSRYMDNNNLSWRNITKEECSEIVNKVSSNLLEKMQGGPIKNGTKRYQILVKRLDRVVLRAVWLIVEHIKRSSFEPIAYEVDFGEKGKLPPITIELPSGEQIKLTGRIDRVDAFETGDNTYIRIIDYKSGSKDLSLSNVYYGMQLQLVTYLDALWQEDGSKSILPGGILYFRIDDPMVKNRRDITEEELESSIMKQLKMKGLLLADVKIIKEMDKTIDGSSLIIPARINKGDVLGSNSQVATIDQFKTLRKYVRRLLSNMGEEITKGDISIKPYKNKKISSCQYCAYTSICQFDVLLKDNKYRIITDKNDNEVWDLMNQTLLNENTIK